MRSLFRALLWWVTPPGWERLSKRHQRLVLLSLVAVDVPVGLVVAATASRWLQAVIAGAVTGLLLTMTTAVALVTR